MFKLSASQIKTFCGSKAKRAGQYILGIQDVYASQDALTLGHLAEHYIITKQDDYSILDKNKVLDGEKMIATYDIIKHNAQGIELPAGVQQRKVEGELMGHHRVGYIDLCTEDCIYDIKTAQYLTKKDGAINMWSGMSTYDEYMLQLWIYAELTGIDNAKIVEVAKHKYKEEDRHENQIIDYVFDGLTRAEMYNKYKPIVDEMYDLYTKFAK